MEEHFLRGFVAGIDREPPKPWYNPDGDCIVYQTVDEPMVAERIDEVLTIYRAIGNKSAIGYQIKGVKALARLFGWDGVLVESRADGGELREVSLSALLLSAYEQGPKTIGRRRGYAEALDSGDRGLRVPAKELELHLS